MPRIKTTQYDLRSWRIRHGLTQQGGADTLCIGLRQFQNWEEAGAIPQSAMKLIRMLDAVSG